MARIFILLSVILISVYVTEQAYFLQQDYIDKINSEVTTWTAGVNFDPNTPKERILKLLGSKLPEEFDDNADSIEYKSHDEAYNQVQIIPDTFDAREEWKHCRIIGEIRDQGNCGNGWAVAPSSAFADRLCIASGGKIQKQLSMEEATFCCHSCGEGCQYGDSVKAWSYFHKHGLVSGGDYKSYEGCQPYRVPPCEFDEYGNNTCDSQPREKNHRCTRMCYGEKDIDFQKDHYHTSGGYRISYAAIQSEVLAYGPVSSTFYVYDDFLNYKSGVYVKSTNAKLLGYQDVKLIGWGEENGVPYWLMVNSWNEYWGEKGLFKVRRGTNECKVDNRTSGGVPELRKIHKIYN